MYPKKSNSKRKDSQSNVKALKATVIKKLNSKSNDEIDEMVRGFLMVRTIPREVSVEKSDHITALNTALVDLNSFAYDTGAGEGISTRPEDFVYINQSPQMTASVKIQGPSVGTPTCLGRGPLVYMFGIGGIRFGLIHPSGILASSANDSPQFRLASAMQLKQRGVMYIAGKFGEQDHVQCARSLVKFPANDTDGILTVHTVGTADEISNSDEFKGLLEQIENGLASPLV
jgi:hypothetical protein